MELVPGMKGRKTIVVENRHVASHLGSGGVPVYATPSMVLHMEETSRDAVEAFLGEGRATVGASISVRHLAPTPVGMSVTVESELVKVEGRLLTFRIVAEDEVECIGEAEHVRAIIDLERFGQRIEKKRRMASGGAK